MNNFFKIRILIKGQEDFIRELEIKANQNFQVLHDFLVKKLRLGGNELASFHITDERWMKKQEITLIDMLGQDEKTDKKSAYVPPVKLMSKTKLNEELTNIGDRLLYEYDFLQMHTFHLEVVDVLTVKESVIYPIMSLSKGTPALQEKVDVEDSEKLKQELLRGFNMMMGDDEDEQDDFDENDDF